ncbi:PDZ domain-containing protein [Panacibacter sp. DH6]|uniref:PDZ domain-containing protein n=1 Tax=Panacibacter microcysteis TaxID=2793269 RepID=A0A931E081_9BACT|nr:PDZ domain-containing protein [Panacibacter microcysteis]MBG9374688.1 PDZ domain-containing protein [Panacibacter microcysteis]
MKAFIKPVLLGLSLVFTTGLFAQTEKEELKEKKEKREKKESDVIIRKKGNSKEKMTIVIEGDQVTVNGKPVEDFKSDDLLILKNGEDFDMVMPPLPPVAMAPGSFGGSFDTEDFSGDFDGNIIREIRSNKAFLGVMTKKVADGASITEVTKESAAEKAGFKTGDIITKVNDTKITDADDLYKAIGSYKPEEKVTITYKRDGKENKATVVLGENKQVRVYSWNNNNDDAGNMYFNRRAPRVEGFGNGYPFDWSNKPRLGVQIQETEDGKGVKVLDVDADEAAGKAGIQENDIITSVNGKAITSLQELKDVMRNAKQGDTVKLDILRDGKPQVINIRFPKELKTTDL